VQPELPARATSPDRLAVKWDFNLFRAGSEELGNVFRGLLDPDVTFGQISVRDQRLFVSRAQVGDSKWHMFTVVERDRALASLEGLHQNARRLGYLAVLCIALLNWLLLVYLRRRSATVSGIVARPVTEVAEATKDLGASLDPAETGVAEVDTLVKNFTRMREELTASLKELKETVDRLNEEIVERERAQAIAGERENALVRAEKMATLGILVSGVAHEINNPNNYMLLNSNNLADIWSDLERQIDKRCTEAHEFMVAGMPYDEAKKEIGPMITGIAEGSERIRRIVENLKDFARNDPGRMDETVDVNKVVGASASILANLIRKTTDRFALELEEGLPTVRGNAQQIEQVVINLISNACDALGDRSAGIIVRTHAEADGGIVGVEVSDEGTGIRAEDLKHIMDPFFTTKRDSGGTGLGLAISYKIAEAHGGELTLQSEVGKGTTATLTLPTAREVRS
jgi:signal transduction histidine kinase